MNKVVDIDDGKYTFKPSSQETQKVRDLLDKHNINYTRIGASNGKGYTGSIEVVFRFGDERWMYELEAILTKAGIVIYEQDSVQTLLIRRIKSCYASLIRLDKISAITTSTEIVSKSMKIACSNMCNMARELDRINSIVWP